MASSTKAPSSITRRIDHERQRNHHLSRRGVGGGGVSRYPNDGRALNEAELKALAELQDLCARHDMRITPWFDTSIKNCVAIRIDGGLIITTDVSHLGLSLVIKKTEEDL